MCCVVEAFNDTLPQDDVISHPYQIHLLGRGTGPLNFRCSSLAYDDEILATLGRLVTIAAFASSHYTQQL